MPDSQVAVYRDTFLSHAHLSGKQMVNKHNRMWTFTLTCTYTNVMRRWTRHTCKILTEPEPLFRGVQPVACGYFCTGHRVLCPLLPTAVRVSRDIPNKNQRPFELAQTLH
jgi:predicted oxidoreductase